MLELETSPDYIWKVGSCSVSKGAHEENVFISGRPMLVLNQPTTQIARTRGKKRVLGYSAVRLSISSSFSHQPLCFWPPWLPRCHHLHWLLLWSVSSFLPVPAIPTKNRRHTESSSCYNIYAPSLPLRSWECHTLLPPQTPPFYPQSNRVRKVRLREWLTQVNQFMVERKSEPSFPLPHYYNTINLIKLAIVTFVSRLQTKAMLNIPRWKIFCMGRQGLGIWKFSRSLKCFLKSCKMLSFLWLFIALLDNCTSMFFGFVFKWLNHYLCLQDNQKSCRQQDNITTPYKQLDLVTWQWTKNNSEPGQEFLPSLWHSNCLQVLLFIRVKLLFPTSVLVLNCAPCFKYTSITRSSK